MLPVDDSEFAALPAAGGSEGTSAASPPSGRRLEEGRAGDVDARLRDVIERHYDFVWRTLQVVGMTAANAEDGAQQVMCVLARRIGDIEPGAETAFLFQTAMRIAAEWRRTTRRRPQASDAVDVESLVAQTPSAEELLDQRRARELLGKVLEALPVELRIVFVLFEIEELTMPAIAAMVGVPVGTVASRLRRARETFHAIVARMQKKRDR